MKKKFKKRTHEEQKSFADKISKNKFWKAIQSRRCELILKELKKKNLPRDEREELELLQEASSIFIEAMWPLPN